MDKSALRHDWNRVDHIRACDLLEAGVRAHGVSVIPPGSRLARMISHMRDIASLAKSPRAELPENLTRRLEFYHLSRIGGALARATPNAESIEMVRRFVCDELHPSSRQKSPGRDSQFQLSMWALAVLAKLDPELMEPDIVFKWAGDSWSVAAKRAKSLAALRAQIRSGTRQLRKCTPPRIMMVDMSYVMTVDMESWKLPVVGGLRRVVEDRIDRKYASIVDSCQRELAKPECEAVLFYRALPVEFVERSPDDRPLNHMIHETLNPVHISPDYGDSIVGLIRQLMYCTPSY